MFLTVLLNFLSIDGRLTAQENPLKTNIKRIWLVGRNS